MCSKLVNALKLCDGDQHLHIVYSAQHRARWQYARRNLHGLESANSLIKLAYPEVMEYFLIVWCIDIYWWRQRQWTTQVFWMTRHQDSSGAFVLSLESEATKSVLCYTTVFILSHCPQKIQIIHFNYNRQVKEIIQEKQFYKPLVPQWFFEQKERTEDTVLPPWVMFLVF